MSSAIPVHFVAPLRAGVAGLRRWPGRDYAGSNRKCFSLRNFGILTAFLLVAPMARAGPNDAALLQQVKQAAAQGQDAQTTAQINQYVDQNQNAISAILNGYVNYLKQIQTMTADDGNGPQSQPQSAPAASGTTQSAGATPAASPAPATAPQSSTALVIAGVQPSGGLRTSHLAGYPALPDVDPVSSITQPTAAQLAYAAKVQKEMQERKAYLMAHPEGYTY